MINNKTGADSTSIYLYSGNIRNPAEKSYWDELYGKQIPQDDFNEIKFNLQQLAYFLRDAS